MNRPQTKYNDARSERGKPLPYDGHRQRGV